jgi:hypothetical protein
VAPETEKPVPVADADVIVTGPVPAEVSVRERVDAAPADTLPKAMLVALTVSVGVPAVNCKANPLEALPALAVSVTVCVVLTAETVAEKAAPVAPAGTVTVAGTVTAELLLARFTVNPPLAAATFTATVQASLPAPVMDEFAQESAVNTGTPVPLKLTTVDAPVEELLPRVSCPVAAPAAVGSNCTESAVVSPGFKVTGKLPPDIVKPVPATVAELMVRAAAPVEVRVRTCVVGVFTATVPKATLVALALSTGLATSTSMPKF